MTPSRDPDSSTSGLLAAVHASLDQAAVEAHHGCGLSYEYYVRRFSALAGPIIDAVPPNIQDEARRIAVEYGFCDPDDVEDYGPGRCSLTGIEEDCCSCGRHP